MEAALESEYRHLKAAIWNVRAGSYWMWQEFLGRARNFIDMLTEAVQVHRLGRQVMWRRLDRELGMVQRDGTTRFLDRFEFDVDDVYRTFLYHVTTRPPTPPTRTLTWVEPLTDIATQIQRRQTTRGRGRGRSRGRGRGSTAPPPPPQRTPTPHGTPQPLPPRPESVGVTPPFQTPPPPLFDLGLPLPFTTTTPPPPPPRRATSRSPSPRPRKFSRRE